MDTPHRRHSLATWRYLGRVAFRVSPGQRCLPPPDDPAAREAWCDGFRLAWCDWYARLPPTELDDALLEFALSRALQGNDLSGDTGEKTPAVERSVWRSH
ncbi:hypothetical protein U5801_25780 [Lamprobacter modestohalophilus]|uniref:hypothetical protein n=1 Tax=Lamprobacter modestohalophilus TaxID=1064514 RepID=UPI002ADEABD6|nr:hypothetical protein [Lamprobacter modestohalophilus]MEA1053192.1 hypothetical protein [Lamprobacter modestohalophilus]